MQSVFCTFEYKMKAGHFVRSFFVWVRGLFAAVDGSVVMSVKQCGRLRAKRGKQGFARKSEIADKTHQSAHWVLAQGRFL